MDVKVALALGVGLLLFTTYYLEKKVPREKIFWGYAGVGVALGLASVYAVAKRLPSYADFITLAVIAILIAILYFEEVEESVGEVEEKATEEKKAD